MHYVFTIKVLVNFVKINRSNNVRIDLLNYSHRSLRFSIQRKLWPIYNENVKVCLVALVRFIMLIVVILL